MKFIVCIKQVPDTETKIKINSDGTSIDSSAVKWVMNPYDEHAIEESLKLREANAGSTVTVVTVGPKKRAGDALRTALAMGADEGVLIDAAENLDTMATAWLLAAALKQEGEFSLVLTGKLAIDDNQSSVSQMLAEFLGVPHTTVVSKLSFGPEKCVAEREIEGGAREVVQLSVPALIAANKGLNMPRYASLPGIMKAKKKVLKEIDGSTLGLPADLPKVTFSKISLPPEKPAVKMVSGDPADQAAQLVQLLMNEVKVL